MARVANCPQCEHDLFVPDDAEPSALVKCPQCRAFFELQHAESRELPAALVVQSHTAPSSMSTLSTTSPTLDDFSSLATVNIDLGMFSDDESKGVPSDTVIHELVDEAAGAEQGATLLPVSQFVDEPQEINPAEITESHEEAAQRIDQWFRSAKTLSEVPALDAEELAGRTSSEMVEPTSDMSGGTQPDVSSDEPAFAGNAADLQLESPADLPNDAAPWDDSQHMDRLLSDLEEQPIDTFETVSHDSDDVAHEEHEQFQPAGDWTPDESISIPTSVGTPEPKRSIVRTLVMSSVGGLFGLALGYYALLWLGPVLHRGKDIDFLQVAQYLPKAILPPAFRTEVKPLPTQPPTKPTTDLAKSEEAVKSEQTPPADAATAPAPKDSTAQAPVAQDDPAKKSVDKDDRYATPPAKSPKTAVAPAETQATFTAPVEQAKKPADKDDRYATPPAKSEPAMHEPAPLNAPPAKALADSAPKAAPLRINNAPSFTAAEVSSSLAAANAAEAGLTTGNLQDGKEIARTKGASYIAIADFAQKATFADSSDTASSQQQGDEFFRKLLSDAHARNEVGQIVPRWMSHPRRPQNGVFFAGSVKHVDILGSVIEYTVELSDGPSIIVVVPVVDRSDSVGGPKGPVAVAGSIIDKPSADIPGYTGKALQVVFAKKLLPL